MTGDIIRGVLIWAGLCVCALMLWHLFVSYNKERAYELRCALCRRRPVPHGVYICGPCCATLLDGPGPDHERTWR